MGIFAAQFTGQIDCLVFSAGRDGRLRSSSCPDSQLQSDMTCPLQPLIHLENSGYTTCGLIIDVHVFGNRLNASHQVFTRLLRLETLQEFFAKPGPTFGLRCECSCEAIVILSIFRQK